MSTPEQRRRYKAHWAEYARVYAERQRLEKQADPKRAAAYFIDHGVWPHRPQLPPLPVFPADLRGLVCGGKSRRTGNPCQSRALHTNGRCKWHGGLSTGPKTAKGKAKSAQNFKLMKVDKSLLNNTNLQDKIL